MSKAMIRSLYNAKINSGNIRYQTYPAAAAGVAMVSDNSAAAWAWAAYVQIVAASTISDPCWLVGYLFHTCAVETHYGDLAIASGAAGSETDLIITPYRLLLAGTTANLAGMPGELPTYFPYPVKVSGAPRLAGRIRKSTAASSAGGTLKVITATVVGS